jgi:HlyD family secretion protein
VLSAAQRLNNARLTLTEAERSLAGATLKAPAAGKVLSVSGAVGSRVSAGSGFIVLGGVRDVAITAHFTEADIASLKLKQSATVTIADGDAQEYPGTVTQIDPVGTVSGRLVKYGATVTFTDPPTTLLLGQTVNVIVTTSAVTGVIYVPSAAVTGVHGNEGTVTVRTSAGEATRPVELGLRGDLYTEIKSGLVEGDVVLLTR